MKDFSLSLDDLQRREFLAGIAKATLGVSILPGAIDAATTGGGYVKPKNPKAKNVIFIYMQGRMSHLDTFDPKSHPETKGISSPIKTNADGLQISSLLPNLAKHGDKMAVIRTMSQKTGAHDQARYVIHTMATAQRPGPATRTSAPGHNSSLAGGTKRCRTASSSTLETLAHDYFPRPCSFPHWGMAKGIRDLLPKIPKNQFNHQVRLAQKFSGVFEKILPPRRRPRLRPVLRRNREILR